MITARIIRILIIDDSAFARKVVRELLATAPLIEVVGSARDGEEALEMLDSLEVDVVVCDLKMPKLDGAGFVRRQMMRRPLPILILSAAAQAVGRGRIAPLPAGIVGDSTAALRSVVQRRGRVARGRAVAWWAGHGRAPALHDGELLGARRAARAAPQARP